jgi:hypothetical protein
MQEVSGSIPLTSTISNIVDAPQTATEVRRALRDQGFVFSGLVATGSLSFLMATGWFL